MLNAAVIGLGVGEAHIEGFNSHPECKVIKACDFNKEVLEKAKIKYPDIEFTYDSDKILLDPNINIVSIASYDNFHFEQIIKGLENDKHLFIEKPIVQFQNHAVKIKKILNKNKSTLISSNLVLRQYEQFQELKKLISSGKIGEISYINASYNYGRIKKITEGWRGNIDYYSVVLGGGIHLIDLLLWLMQVKVQYVFAMGNRVHTKASGFKFNDLVTALLYFENDIIAVVNSNFGAVTPHFHQLEIYGTKLTFVNSRDHYLLYNKRDKKNYNENDLIKKNHYNIVENSPLIFPIKRKIEKGFYLYDFVDSILNNKEPLVKQQEIFNTLSICFAIEKSLESNEKIKVQYL